MAKKLFVVDGMAHIYRAYFGVRGLSNSAGVATNAVFGFTSILRKVQASYQPDYFVVAMDSKEPSFRKDIFPDYKANRAEMPEDLQAQIPYIFKVCEALGVATLKIPGYEADDIIGTLARIASERGVDTVIVSNDKDMSQLASERVSVLRVDNKTGNFVSCDAEGVKEWMGVAPAQVIDALALRGDPSDNVPGAPGIGEKGAIQIIQQFGALEAALERYEEVKKKTYRESLRDHREQILRAKRLVTICQTAPVPPDLDALVCKPPDAEMAYALFSELEFKALTSEFAKGRTAPDAPVRAVAIEAARQYSRLARAEEAKRFFDGLYARDAFAFHLEDAAGAFVGCSFSFGPGHAVRLDAATLEADAEARRAFAEIFENGLVTKACCDAKRALYVLNRPPHAERPVSEAGATLTESFSFAPPALSDSLAPGRTVRFEGLTDDVALAAYVLDPGAPSESLTVTGIAARHLSLSAEELSQAEPADLVMRLVRGLRPKLEAEGLTRIYEDMELPLIDILFDMECAGVRIDPKPLQELEVEIVAVLEGLKKEIHALAGGPFNISSPKQVAEVFEKLNYELSKKTATGKISTSADALEELAEKYDLPKLILEHREYEKLLNTYVTVLPRLVNARTGRLHTTFTQTVTSTGRLSSVRPNLQNVPVRTELGRRTRRAFVANPGNILISADYSQIELRLLAHITGDRAMTEAFRAHEDVHTRTARAVFGARTPEEIRDARRLAKATNFGIAYGVGPYGLARNVGITRKEARQAIENYFAAYPGIKRYMDETPEKGRESGFVRTMFGRLRRLPDLKSRNYTLRSRAEREAINAPIQGAAADIMKLAMIEIAKRLARERLRTRMVLQVHDEIVLESPESERAQVMTLVKEAMEGVVELNVPLVAEVHAGANWLDAK
jgi:DNA polymerase I